MQKTAEHSAVQIGHHSAVGSDPLDRVTRDTIRKFAITTLGLLVLIVMPGFRVLDVSIGGRDRYSETVLSWLPDGHRQGDGATVGLKWRARAPGLLEPTISTFTLTLAPGGSAILHRTPSPGYVIVHVLSGAIEAQAWHAGLGTYSAAATWAQPAFAYDITAVNASASEPARAFVLVVANGGD